MRKGQIHLFGFNCTYISVCPYFQEKYLGFDRKNNFGNELRGRLRSNETPRAEGRWVEEGTTMLQESTAVLQDWLAAGGAQL